VRQLLPVVSGSGIRASVGGLSVLVTLGQDHVCRLALLGEPGQDFGTEVGELQFESRAGASGFFDREASRGDRRDRVDDAATSSSSPCPGAHGLCASQWAAGIRYRRHAVS
jgi:hypothetical protein